MTLPTDPVPTFVDSPSTSTPLDSANLNEYSTAIVQLQTYVAGLQVYIPFTGVQTASTVTASANTYVLVDTTSNSVTVDFPTAPTNFTVVGVKQVTRGGTNTVTAQLGGSDHFDTTTGSQTATLTLQGQAGVWQYNSSTAVWVRMADDLPLSQLDSRYVASGGSVVTSVTAGDSTITMGGTGAAPTVKVAQGNLTLAESQVTGLTAALNPTYSAGSAWGPNVYGTLMENTERDDVTSTYAMTSSLKTLLVLIGLCPAASYSVFKTFQTVAQSGGTLTAALYSSATISGTSWSRLGSGNITATLSSGIASNSLPFTLSSPAFVALLMSFTSSPTTYPTLSATAAGAVQAGLFQPASGCPLSADQSGAVTPGATLNPLSSFTTITQKIWCALA